MNSVQKFLFCLMETKKQTSGWLIAVLLFALFMFSASINFDITEFIQKKNLGIPAWYFISIFSADLLFLISLVLIFFRKKIGTLLYPIAVFTHFLIANYYLNAFLYFDLFTIFIFFSAILLVVIPRWETFK